MIQNTARVHPATIYEFSTGKVWRPVKHHTPRAKHEPVRTTVMNKEIWKTALKLANNDRSRIEVVNEECVIVHNGSDKAIWPKQN